MVGRDCRKRPASGIGFVLKTSLNNFCSKSPDESLEIKTKHGMYICRVGINHTHGGTPIVIAMEIHLVYLYRFVLISVR